MAGGPMPLANDTGGARRRSRIAGRAQQRIDYTLDRLRRAGYVQSVRSIGSGDSPDPMYEIADPYLAHWFAVLRDDADLIEGGQGRAVQARTDGRWQTHIARVYEATARDHVQRLISAGQLAPDTVVGRWWRDEVAEIDVLALNSAGPTLVGECRWQSKPITERDLAELRRKAARLPPSATITTYAFRSRNSAENPLAGHPDVWTFTPTDLLGE
jgi:hypothetical protein